MTENPGSIPNPVDEHVVNEFPEDMMDLHQVELRRFIFFMKGISENGLWDEVERYFRTKDITSITISAKPILTAQELLRSKLAAGEQLTPRAARISSCGLCTDPDD